MPKQFLNLSKILTNEMRKLEKWMDENELILNAKKGKTEVLVFGTAQRLKRQSEEICIQYKGPKSMLQLRIDTWEWKSIQL